MHMHGSGHGKRTWRGLVLCIKPWIFFKAWLLYGMGVMWSALLLESSNTTFVNPGFDLKVVPHVSHFCLNDMWLSNMIDWVVFQSFGSSVRPRQRFPRNPVTTCANIMRLRLLLASFEPASGRDWFCLINAIRYTPCLYD
jgi:hypothetical protein